MKARHWRIVYAIAVLASFVFNYGAINAEVKYECNHQYKILHQSQQDNIDFIVEESLLGAVVLSVPILILTNFCEHGWTLGSGWQS